MVWILKRKNGYRSVVLFFLLVLLGGLFIEAQAEEWDDVAFLSSLENDVVRELNLARTNPQAYRAFLQELLPLFKGNLLNRPGKITLVTKEGVRAVNEAIGFLELATPINPLSISEGMSKGAMDHVKDSGPAGRLGHEGVDHSQPGERVNRYGKWKKTVGENIAYGHETAREIVIGLIVDDGVPNRGHRKNIFNASFNVVGVACGFHAVFDPMCVTTLAGSYHEANP